MQHLNSFFAALQKREVTEIEQRTRMLGEQFWMETAESSELHAQFRQLEQQNAALGSQMELCRDKRDCVLTTLDRLNEKQIEGANYVSTSCFIITLCATSIKGLGMVVRRHYRV